ncbi:hypothetical protein KB874_14975 [Aestuariicoccus sp. KMU-90]|uniref:Uncharacterized protein n=1 Tax=Thetidibacter halocola TaxID=2827239 RepID=A0A8J7WD48_9RHOB|nr:hypothetical protein [Thetidibacter halocola]
MTRLILTGLVMAAAQGAAAREVFVDNLAGYVIEADILDAPGCTGPAFDTPALEDFEKGLCRFHKPARSAEQTEAAARDLRRAQTLGLPPVHQQLAALTSGLLQCAEAQRHLDAFRASGQMALLERERFCKARRLSQADLNAIRWDHALFDYAEGMAPERRLTARLTEMSACHAGVLAPAFDAECGLITNVTATEIEAFVDEAVADVITTYFRGVESPITAMFARKRSRAEGILERAGTAIAELGARAAELNDEYDVYETVYSAARDARMTPIYENYRDAILQATAILDEYERWKGGLFITSENVNLLPKIVERRDDIADELGRITETDFLPRAEKIVEDVRALVNAEAANRDLIGKLCRVYFCELTTLRNRAATIDVCRQPGLADNPLCLGQNGAPVSGVLSVAFGGGQTIAVQDLCRSAGVDQVFLAVGLSPSTARTCTEALP